MLLEFGLLISMSSELFKGVSRFMFSSNISLKYKYSQPVVLLPNLGGELFSVGIDVMDAMMNVYDLKIDLYLLLHTNILLMLLLQ